MKRILNIVLMVLLLTTICACDDTVYHWEFEYGVEKIKSIKIIEINNDAEYTVIYEVDKELFVDVVTDIENIEMRKYGTNPSSPYGKCVMITFVSGEYDIISQKEPQHYKYDTLPPVISGYISWLTCDPEQFDNLIIKYSK